MFPYINRGGEANRNKIKSKTTTVATSITRLDDAIRQDLQSVLLPKYIQRLEQQQQQQQQQEEQYQGHTSSRNEIYQPGSMYQSIFIPFFQETKMGLLLRLQSTTGSTTTSALSPSVSASEATTNRNNRRAATRKRSRNEMTTQVSIEEGTDDQDIIDDDSHPSRNTTTKSQRKPAKEKNPKTTGTTKYYGFIPTQRCDVYSYIQFIFSMLQDTLLSITSKIKLDDTSNCNNVHDPSLLYEISFYICSYYTFLQMLHPPTSSLMSNGRSTTTYSKYAFLAVGLQSYDNPKTLYRKYYYYYTKIRITMSFYYTVFVQQLPHYLHLQKSKPIHDSRTPTQQLQQQQQQYHHQLFDNHLCNDCLAIIQRLIQNTNKYFDLVSYHGPCSLEGYSFKYSYGGSWSRCTTNNNSELNPQQQHLSQTNTAKNTTAPTVNTTQPSMHRKTTIDILDDDNDGNAESDGADRSVVQLSNDDTNALGEEIQNYMDQSRKLLQLHNSSKKSSLHRLLHLYQTKIPTRGDGNDTSTNQGMESNPTFSDDVMLDSTIEEPEIETDANVKPSEQSETKQLSEIKVREEQKRRITNFDDGTTATNLDVPDHESIWTATTTTTTNNNIGPNALERLLQQVTIQKPTVNKTSQQSSFGDFFLQIHTDGTIDNHDTNNKNMNTKTKLRSKQISKKNLPKGMSLPAIVQLVNDLPNDIDLYADPEDEDIYDDDDDSVSRDDDEADDNYDDDDDDDDDNSRIDRDDITTATGTTNYSMTPGQNALSKLLSYVNGPTKT